MKVLAAIIAPPHLKASGGAGAGERLSNALARHCDITIASMLNGAGERAGDGQSTRAPRVNVKTWLPPGLPWSRLPNNYKTLFYRSDIPDLIATGAYDLVHIHNPTPALEMERVARACLKHNVSYIVATHGFNEIENGLRVLKLNALQRQVWRTCMMRPVQNVIRNAEAIFALTPADFEFVRRVGFKGSELTVVSNGVPPSGVQDPEADFAALNRLGIPVERTPGQITCMFLANHTPNKGVSVLLSAFTQLNQPYLLILAGDKRAAIDYESYINRCKPGQRIVVTGRLDDKEVDACFRRADLFVFPTLAETFGIVLLEAMSHGLPVIATRVGGIPHFVPNDCGVLISAGDVTELKEAVERLAREDPAKLRAMGERGRAQAARYTWEAAAIAAADGYRRIYERTRRPAASLGSKSHVEKESGSVA